MPKINLSTLPKSPKHAVKKLSQKESTMAAKKAEKYIESNKIDLSCEDRGFFLYNGKVVPIVFPR